MTAQYEWKRRERPSHGIDEQDWTLYGDDEVIAHIFAPSGHTDLFRVMYWRRHPNTVVDNDYEDIRGDLIEIKELLLIKAKMGALG